MASRKNRTAQEENDTTDVATDVTADVEVSERTRTLTLNQNQFVNGQFAKEGSQFTFTESEAAHRLKTQQFWVK